MRSLVPAVLAAVAVLALPPVAAADSASATAKIAGSTVSVGSPVLAKVNLHTKFSSIESVCFQFTFAGDLLDPGELLRITPLRLLPSEAGPGIQNVGSAPQAERTLCIDSSSPVAGVFSDGKEKDLELAIQTGTFGSVNIASLVVTVTGTTR
jgi:hypothetical protein